MVFACAALVWAAAGTEGRAEEPPVDPDLATEGLRRVGPFHLRPLLLLKDVGYDDNVRFDARQAEGDTTATAGAGLQALLLTGDRGGVRLYQEFDYVAFGRNTDLNHWNASTSAKGLLVTRRLLFTLEDRFNSLRERPNTEVDLRLRRENNSATVGMRTLGKGRLGVRTYARHERIDYGSDEAGSDTVARRLSRKEDTLAAAGELRIFPKTTFVLEGALERVDFEDATQGRNTRARTILSGFRFDPSATVQGDFRIGRVNLSATDRPQSDYRGTIGQGHLSKRLGRASRAKARFERSLEFSTLAENLYYVHTEWAAAYEQFFSRRLSAEIAYGRGLNHYPEEIVRAGTDPFQGTRDDRLTTHQVSIRYRINQQLSMVTSAYRLRRDSNDDVNDRERSFYTFGSTYSF